MTIHGRRAERARDEPGLRLRQLILAVALCATAAASYADTIVFRHEPAGCLVAERYPVLRCCLESSDPLSEVRVYFQAAHASEWHFVAMQPSLDCFRAILPRPHRFTRRVRYLFAATGPLSGQSRSEVFTVEVVSGDASCAEGEAAPFLSQAEISLRGDGSPVGFLPGHVAP